MCQLMTRSATVHYGFFFDVKIIPGIIWDRTCVPSMPTQLKVECGNLLLINTFRSLFSSDRKDKEQTHCS